jgi:sec-independent protein translocase protein TatB
MLDFGWSEFFLIIILAIVLMGPKDIPEVIHGFGRLVRRIQYMKFALSKQFDDFMEKADLNDLRRGALGDVNPKNIMTPLPPNTTAPNSPPMTTPSDEMGDDEAYYAEANPNDPNTTEIPHEPARIAIPKD